MNDSYKLDPNSNLVPLSKVKFKPITEEHRSRIKRETIKFRKLHRKDCITAAVYFAIGLILIALGVILGIKFNMMLLAILLICAAFFLGISILLFVRRVRFHVTGFAEATITYRETHQYTHNDFDQSFYRTETITKDRITVKIDETGDEVSVLTDKETQMHSIPGKKVWLLKTSAGPVISLD